jgi:hypothetical protein
MSIAPPWRATPDGDAEEDTTEEAVRRCVDRSSPLELVAFPAATIAAPVGVFWAWTWASPLLPLATPPGKPAVEATNVLNAAGFATFMGAQFLVLAVSWAAIVAGLEILRRFLFDKVERRLGLDRIGRSDRVDSLRRIAFVVWHAGLVLILFFAFGWRWFEGPVRYLSAKLPFAAMMRGVVDLAGAADVATTKQILNALHAKLTFGAQSGLAGALLTTLAAAAIGYRWANIGVVWYRPEDLARQRSWLIGLFVLASALLVVSAAALRAAQDWPAGLIAPEAVESGGRKLAEVAKALGSASTSLWGEMSTTLLLAAFGPAFWGLSRDIKLAAQIGLVSQGLRASSRQGTFKLVTQDGDPGGPFAGALELSLDAAPAAASAKPGDKGFCQSVDAILRGTTYGDIQKWSEDHGLNLSGGQIATALIAAAAPLVASPVIDFSKFTAL